MKLPRRRRGKPLRLDDAGWVDAALRTPSPNFDARPPGTEITLVVVHGISLPPGRFGGPGIAALFANRLRAGAHPYYAGIANLRVSAHFVIRRHGELLQFVSCSDRAWHAGASQWQGRAACNDYSIGIELEGTDTIPYTGGQYRALGRLVDALRRRHPIAHVVGHCDVAPGRKTDPGPAFDWKRFVHRREGSRAGRIRVPDAAPAAG